MTAWTVLLVAVGAVVGAPLRYVADTAAKKRFASAFPWGTFAVNVAGSLVLGAVTAGAGVFGHAVQALVGTGFCGALTTYSTFGYEIVSLTERGDRRTAVIYLLVSVVLGVLAAAAGFALVRAAL
ncbi:fluoride efflux transporter CrcB [Pseudonocardia endophytica]|uniref:Fluoride-specific ion channel FluC n=1 Tax=Pseudonocardia endophytica TaxID=401976 RepID=A0A4V2PHY9_PSEEN|nr:fluoride efflux transporter CrcB [Pseudonocardia endophytica]TCK22476.1 CrcB protein [Pseudonocardia endophytica]